MDLLAARIRPRDIVTREALENAAVVVAASGGSTNAALHLPAIAHEAGIEFDLDDVGGSSGARPTSPISSRAADTSPRTCTRSAACRC